MLKKDFEDIVSSHVIYDIGGVIKEKQKNIKFIFKDIFKLPY